LERGKACWGGAIERLGRRDWLHTAIGVIVTIITSLGALLSETAGEFYHFASQRIGAALELAVDGAKRLLE